MDTRKKQILIIGGVLLTILMVGLVMIYSNYTRTLEELNGQLGTNTDTQAQEELYEGEGSELPNAYEGLEDLKFDGLTLTDSLGHLTEGLYIVQSIYTPSERNVLVDEGILVFNFTSADERRQITGLDSESDIVLVDSGKQIGMEYTDVGSVLEIRDEVRRGGY